MSDRGAEIEHDRAAGVWQAVTDNIADGLYVVDGYGSILYVNQAGLRMLGYEADELVGRDVHAALYHGLLEAASGPVERSPLAAVNNVGTGYETVEDCFWRKDGSMLMVAYSSSRVPLGDRAGSVVVFRDISAQRAAAAAQQEAELLIRRSEALHRTLTANLPDTSVFLIDHDLCVLVADGEAIRRLGWLGDDLFRGRKVSELYAEVPNHVLHLSLENYAAALRGERRSFEFDSEGLTFAVQAVPVRTEDGTVEAALVVARDITERTRAAQQLARHARQQHAIAELGSFALQSHDLSLLMTEAVTKACATLGVDVAGVLELDDEHLTLVAAVGVPEQVLGVHRTSLAESSIAGHILRTGEPVIIEDSSTETRFASLPSLPELGVVSSLSVAIDGHDRLFGILYVHTSRSALLDRYFSPHPSASWADLSESASSSLRSSRRRRLFSIQGR